MSQTEQAAPPTEPATRVNWVVFVGSSAGILAIAVWSMVAPSAAAAAIGVVVGWASRWFGWFYILLATVILVFVLVLAFSRYGKTKLGPQHSKPEFGTFSWAAMLFAAGIGTDVMFFSVAEPVTQYLDPPAGQGETVEAARQATVWTLFHYGITGWGMYALMGMALAYFAYRMNLPLSIRSALYPLAGRRIYGPLGHGVDLAAVLGTIFGIATSLGIGVVLLNYGLTALFGIPEGLGAQTGLVVLAIIMATVSAVTGVDRGIRRLSQLNVLLAIVLALFLLVSGRTAFLLNAFVQDIGNYVATFADKTLETFAFTQPTAWLNTWTLFFWAWWIAWASFVGLFLARISRGRTIRQFVVGTLTIPFFYIVMWVSIFGNSALSVVRGGNEGFGETAVDNPARGFYDLLAEYPAFGVVASVATFVGLLFYVTSADSGALVMGDLTSYRKTPQDDAPPPLRIFWATATGLLTLAMLIVGGVPALQNATIIMGLPFAFVLVLVMLGLYKALRVEGYRADSHQRSLPGSLSGRGTDGADRAPTGEWRRRLRRSMDFPTYAAAVQFLGATALPAVSQVTDELREHGVEATVHDGTGDQDAAYVELRAGLGEEPPFVYRISPQKCGIPSYGVRFQPGSNFYYRLEVHLTEGGQDYDVMGYTHGQLMDDILDQYERHLEFARLHREGIG
ncbi:MAG: BCCT family transporter [Streptosporangiales bacterium]|nr:BCCT family transporter [Streptosporangiales bacterium]